MNDDDEHGYMSGLLNTERMSDEVKAALKSYLQITTDKIEPFIIKAIQKLELTKTMQSHDERLTDVERRQKKTTSGLIRGLTQVLKIISGDD